jgi:hypothetical protein
MAKAPAHKVVAKMMVEIDVDKLRLVARRRNDAKTWA